MRTWLCVVLFVTGCVGATRSLPTDSPTIKAMKTDCATGSATKCNELGLRYLHGTDGTKQNFDWARELFQDACDDRNAAACGNLGYLYMEGRGAAHNYDRAVAYSSAACESGDGVACGNLAELYRDGKGVDQSLVKATEYYDKACQAHTAYGCMQLATLYSTDRAAESVHYYELACQLDELRGCYMYARALLFGRNVAQNVAEARQVLERTCKRGLNDSCDALKNALPAGE